MMTSKAYSIKQVWYVDIEVVIPDAKHLQYQGRVWQVPIRGSAKSTDHKANVVDLLKQIYDASAKLSDIGITVARSAKVYQLVADMFAIILPNQAKRKQLEAQVSDLRATERVTEAIKLLQEREKNVQKQGKELKSADQPLYILFQLAQILFGTKLTCLKEIHHIVGQNCGIRNSNRSGWHLKKLNGLVYGTREFLKGGTRVIF